MSVTINKSDGSNLIVPSYSEVVNLGAYLKSLIDADLNANEIVQAFQNQGISIPVGLIDGLPIYKTVLEQAQANGHTGTDEAELWALILSGSNVDVANQFYLDAVSEGYTGNEAQFSAAIQQIIADSLDTTAPVITLNGASTINIDEGDTYNELGATTDDGSTVVIDSSNVDTVNAGTYTVTYNATDAAGNVATEVTRTVIVSVASSGTGETATLDDDVVIGFGAYGASVPNRFTSNDVGSSNLTLLNNLSADSGLKLEITSTGTPGDSVNTGLSYGVASFDNTLKNDQVTTHSTFTGSGSSISYVISQLTPNTDYTMQFIGSRTSTQTRSTQIDANGVIGSYNPAADPIEEPLELVVTSDSSGVISTVISATLGDFAYISGILIKL